MARKKDPYTKDPRDPLELLSRMLVESSYRLPVEGTGSRPGLRSCDIAAAVGYMPDHLAAALAIAVATRAPPPAIARLAGLAYKRIAHKVRLMRPRPLTLRKPADRWRLRMVVYDACSEIVWPENRRSFQQLARDTKMRRADYRDVHKVATAEIHCLLANARLDFARAVRGAAL